MSSSARPRNDLADASAQSELFDASGAPQKPSDGYHLWRRQRDDSLKELGRNNGLPLNYLVDVVLRDGVRLRGKLRLLEETLFIEPNEAGPLKLTVDGVVFLASEIETCVRQD